jgi:sigma-E factor negative regulatory protein RseC
MLASRAVVISVDGNQAVVESLEGGGCGKCDSANGCGSSKLSQLFCSEPRRFRVRNEANAQVGATVQIVLAEGVLLRSALLMYVLPLAFLFAGAIFGEHWAAEASREIYAVLGGLTGLIFSYFLLKNFTGQSGLISVARPGIFPQSEDAP